MVQAARGRCPETLPTRKQTKRNPSDRKKNNSKPVKEQPAEQHSIVEAQSDDHSLNVWSKETALARILEDVRMAELKHLGLRPGTLCHIYKDAIIAIEALGIAYLTWQCYRHIRIKGFRLSCDFMGLSDAIACYKTLRQDGIELDELSSAIPPIDLAKEALVMAALSKAPRMLTWTPDASWVLDSHRQGRPMISVPGMHWSSLPEVEVQMVLPLELQEDTVPLQLPEDAVPLQFPEDSMPLQLLQAVPLQLLEDQMALPMQLLADAVDLQDSTADEVAMDEIDDFGRIW